MAETTTPSETTAHRSVALDVLRGIAILLVLGHHAIRPAIPESGPVRWFALAWRNVGWTGVDLFFVLSGFLVGGLIFAEIERCGDFDAPRFVRRRWFRTLPLYAAYLVFLYGWMKVRQGTWPPLKYLRSNAAYLLPDFTFTQNYWTPGTTDHTWSLAVEEHFYLLLPGLILALLAWRGRSGLRAIPWVAAGLIAGCAAIRCRNIGHPFGFSSHYAATHIRLDALFLGVAVAYLHRLGRGLPGWIVSRPRVAIAVALGLLTPFAVLDLVEDRYVWTVGYGHVAVAYAILVAVAASARPRSRGPVARVTASIGSHSYGIYLWHIHLAFRPLGWLEARGFLSGIDPSLRWAFFVAAPIAISYAVARLSHRLIEAPALRWRDRVVPSRARSAVPVAMPAEAPRRDIPPVLAGAGPASEVVGASA